MYSIANMSHEYRTPECSTTVEHSGHHDKKRKAHKIRQGNVGLVLRRGERL